MFLLALDVESLDRDVIFTSVESENLHARPTIFVGMRIDTIKHLSGNPLGYVPYRLAEFTDLLFRAYPAVSGHLVDTKHYLLSIL
jgi:hypothetical protein